MTITTDKPNNKTGINPDDQILETTFEETSLVKRLFNAYMTTKVDFTDITTRSDFENDTAPFHRSLCVQLHKLTGDIWLDSREYFLSRGYTIDTDRITPDRTIYRVKDGLAIFIRASNYNGQKLKVEFSPSYYVLCSDPIFYDGKAIANYSNQVNLTKDLPYDYQLVSISSGKLNAKRIAKRITKDDFLEVATGELLQAIKRHNDYINANNKKDDLLAELSTAFNMNKPDSIDRRRATNYNYNTGIELEVSYNGSKVSVKLTDLTRDKANALAQWINDYDSKQSDSKQGT